MTATTETWVRVLDGWHVTINVANGFKVCAPGDVFPAEPDLAQQLIANGWAAEVDAPEPGPDQDRTGWRPCRVLTELHLDNASYGEGEILDLSPWAQEYYSQLGAIEVIE